MSDRLAEWKHRLTEVRAPLSFPDQQELIRDAVLYKGLLEYADRVALTAVTELKRLREGVNAAADYLADDAAKVCGKCEGQGSQEGALSVCDACDGTGEAA